MLNKKSKTIIPIICVAIIGFIFMMSSDSYSDIKTLKLAETIYNAMPNGIENIFIINGIDIKSIDFVIRKSAHFIEYMILSMVLFKISLIYKIKPKVSFIYILFICLLIANLDEFYQSLVAGRNSEVKDCLIDFAGSVAGLLIFLCFKKLKSLVKKV